MAKFLVNHPALLLISLAFLAGCRSPSNLTPDPIPPTPTAIWAVKATMPTARYGASAVAIGSKAYVLGGRTNGTSYSDSVEVYDMVTNSWTSLSSTDPLPTPLVWSSAVASDNKIFVFGGFNGTAFSDEIFCFDPIQSSGSRWTTLTQTLTGVRYKASSALLNGTAYLIGGNNGGSTVAIVDRIRLTAYPVAIAADDALPDIRYEHTALPVGSVAYVFMGQESSYVNTIRRFDPAQVAGSRWTLVGATTAEALAQAAGGVDSGIAYLFGGKNNDNLGGSPYTQAFDPAGPSVSAKTAMPTARYAACAVAAYGSIYVFGGTSAADGSTALDTTEQYYPPLD